MIFAVVIHLIPQLWVVAIITNTLYQRNFVQESRFTVNAAAWNIILKRKDVKAVLFKANAERVCITLKRNFA